MKVNFNKTIKAIDGTDCKFLKEGEDGKKTKVLLTFKNRVLDSLLAFGQKEASMSGEEKIKLYKLAMKIEVADEDTDYSLDELNIIKKRCEIYMSILFYGQLDDLLETNKSE